VNKLFFGDNLYVLRERVKDESVDLIYLDPPFNSQTEFNVIYETKDNLQETAQRTTFNDTWHFEDEAEAAYRDILANGGQVALLMEGLCQALQRNGMAAYLVAMTVRLIELRRKLKRTGSLYLHCDPTASHYLKIILDVIFGEKSFRNEIIWQRTTSHNSARRYGRIHDSILFYTSGKEFTWNKLFTPYGAAQLGRYKKDDQDRLYKAENLTAERRDSSSGKFIWRGSIPGPSRGWAYTQEQLEQWWSEGRILTKRDGTPRLDGLKVLLDDMPGQPLQDIWTDLPRVANVSAERLGFPTQKPTNLLNRIISVSSNEGDVVLDPYCGCGTTVEAAQQLKRAWVGIDVSYYAVKLIERRVRGLVNAPELRVEGIPADFASAEALAEKDRYGFQQWAVGELGCQLWNDGKKGADGGIDGEMRFFGGPDKIGRLLVQVKGGKKSNPSQIREFHTVMDDAKADMGVFFCRGETTPEMRASASRAGSYRLGMNQVARLQIITLAAWMAGQRPPLPNPLPLQIQGDRSGRPRAGRRPDPKQPEFRFVVEGGLSKAPKGNVLNPDFIPDVLLRDG